MQNAAKVGLLLTVFAVLFVSAFSILGRGLFGAKPDPYVALFPDASGVKVGTPVLMAGVKVGEVAAVSLKDPRLARVDLGIVRGTKIPAGTVATIPTALIGIGETPVTLEPPTQDAGTYLRPGTEIEGRKASALDNILPNGKAAVDEMTATMKAMRKIMEDQALQGQVKDLLASTNRTITEFGNLAGKIDRLVAQNQGQLGQALRSVNGSLANVERITAEVAKMAEDPRLREDAVAIMGSVKGTVAKVDSLVGDVAKMVNDPALRDPIQRAADNVADMSETGKRIADNAERMTANGAVISEKAIGVTEQVGEIAGKASTIADDVRNLTQRVSGILNPKPRPGVLSNLQVGMDLFRESDPGYWRTDFSGTLPFRDSVLHFGIRDAFESNKLTVQVGSPLNQTLGYRYGIFAGRAGLGVDYRVAPRFSVGGDLWDLNHPRLDLRARYDFGNGLVGWLGFDRVMRDNAPTIGIGIRR